MVFWPMLPDMSIPFETLPEPLLPLRVSVVAFAKFRRPHAAVAGERVVRDAELMGAGGSGDVDAVAVLLAMVELVTVSLVTLPVGVGVDAGAGAVG